MNRFSFHMHRRRRDAIVMTWRFVLVVVPTIVVLGVLNALPQFLGGEMLGVIRYGSIEAAEARIGARVYRPRAVPPEWRWPPAAVRFAAVAPGWVELVLESAGGQPPGELAFCQTLRTVEGEPVVPPVLQPAGEVLQADDVQLGSRTVRVRRLVLSEGKLVHELWWLQRGRRVMLRAQLPADALLRMAPAIVETTR